MKQKSGKKRITVFLCIMLVMVFSISVSAFAAEYEVTAKLNLRQEISGTQKTEEIFTYRLDAQEDGIPMPKKQEITGTGAGDTFFEIQYQKVGVYKYTLRQIAGNTANWKYDETVYQVEVYVLRDEDTDELKPLVIYYDEDGNKAEAVFHNSYNAPQDSVSEVSKTTKTGDAAETGMWFVIMMAAAGMVMADTHFRKKAKSE